MSPETEKTEAERQSLLELLVTIAKNPNKWTSYGAGECWAYVSAGCKFHVDYMVDSIRVEVDHKTFLTMEHGGGEEPSSFTFRKIIPDERVNPHKTDYTRDELIVICERAIVPHDKWADRDTPSAQEGVGNCWQALVSGRPFEIIVSGEHSRCVTDDRTIWIVIDGVTYYLPTPKRLDETAGRDWY